MTKLLHVPVHGIPAPQGSKNVNRHGAVYESSRRVRPWREAVKEAVADAIGDMGDDWAQFTGPVDVTMDFYFTRPKGHYGTGRNAAVLRPSAPRSPAVVPDLSKLIRSTEDALTEAGAWRDDALVVHVIAAKHYAAAGGAPGAWITITGAEERW